MKETKLADIEHRTWNYIVGKMEENSKVFKIQTVEKIVNYYSIYGLKSQKEVREHLDNCGLDEGSFDGVHTIRHDWRDYDGEDVKKITTVVFSPCSFFDEYMTPPPDYDESRTKYMASSTMFDEQPEGTGILAKKIWRKYVTCENYIQGSKSQVCPKCIRRIQKGFRIIKPINEQTVGDY